MMKVRELLKALQDRFDPEDGVYVYKGVDGNGVTPIGGALQDELGCCLWTEKAMKELEERKHAT